MSPNTLMLPQWHTIFAKRLMRSGVNDSPSERRISGIPGSTSSPWTSSSSSMYPLWSTSMISKIHLTFLGIIASLSVQDRMDPFLSIGRKSTPSMLFTTASVSASIGVIAIMWPIFLIISCAKRWSSVWALSLTALSARLYTMVNRHRRSLTRNLSTPSTVGAFLNIACNKRSTSSALRPKSNCCNAPRISSMPTLPSPSGSKAPSVSSKLVWELMNASYTVAAVLNLDAMRASFAKTTWKRRKKSTKLTCWPACLPSFQLFQAVSKSHSIPRTADKISVQVL
mmetsp:Transcript_50505/g.141380  ORF Transcript_50505/g.141380 Transcript_50505/m.141380 type:complete len:283 (+) Transcript_50505:466-1314(+)